ncbi:RdgB/HAM1 family non-canonical purine NTP pyrophosphatase [Propionicicella superfundia]|uniref:RdgB/HAM1 family non-canonical purine NTP pyrophosphatase n=1 Tax=Propionicicella superfundia TaxID=348582 RepID=UPI0004201634|nr:RdgB/HAM1 family non-canonical purine NTP pyrophosphatase [Propionicicella superfundia]
MKQIVLATNNDHKLVELRRLFKNGGLEVEVLGLADVPPYEVPPENRRSFEGNALLKARAAMHATGLPSLADDSGLEVDLLNNMPGVRSSRWAGVDATDEENTALLVRQLADTEETQRTARFVAVIAVVMPDGREEVVRGTMNGRIVLEPRGSFGFGYDPIFVAEEYDVTNAELQPEVKDEISHRGKAMRAVGRRLRKLMDTEPL